MKMLISIVWIFYEFLVIPGQVNAQGRGGYDQFGEYVEEAPIDDKGNKERELNRLLQKLNNYQEKLKKEPRNATTHFMMGNILTQLNRPTEAIKSYEEAIELNPWNGETHYNLAKAYDAIRDGDRAIKHVQKADKIFRENLYLHWQTRTRQLLKQLQRQYRIQ